MVEKNFVTLNDKPALQESIESIILGAACLLKHCNKLTNAENPSQNTIQQVADGLYEIDETIQSLVEVLDCWHGDVI